MREGSILYFTEAEYHLDMMYNNTATKFVLANVGDNLAYISERDYIPCGKRIQRLYTDAFLK